MAIGFLLGIVFIMTQQMLILFAIFVERAQLPKQSQTFTGSQQAMAIFAWFLFLIYAAFGLMLAIFRDDVIKEGKVYQAISCHIHTFRIGIVLIFMLTCIMTSDYIEHHRFLCLNAMYRVAKFGWNRRE